MLGANFALAVVIIGVAYRIVLSYEEASLRLFAANAVFAQAVAVGLLARGQRRSMLQSASLHMGVLGILAFGWALVEPKTDGNLLNRAVVATAALAATIGVVRHRLLQALAARERVDGRRRPAGAAFDRLRRRGAGVRLGGRSVSVLQHDGIVQDQPRRRSPPSAAALVGLFAASLAAALLPGRDPLGLSEKGRTAYVYAAEAILALLFMHVRLTMP